MSAGVTVGQADLTALGTSATPEQWYHGLLSLLAEWLDLFDEANELWEAQSTLTPVQRCFSSLVKAVLGQYEGPVVIFIDEIDATLGLPFPADEFFGGIRYCYNHRAHDPEYARITFCLVGVASPADLVREPRLSPFNIGRRIELSDFTAQECAPLARGLRDGETRRQGDGGTRRRGDTEAGRLLERVLYWTGGHPCMTQRLCAAIAASSPAEEGRMPGPAEVDALCRELFLTPAVRDSDPSLMYVSSRLLTGHEAVAEVLDLYARLLRGDRISYRESGVAARELLLSGLVRVSQGSLVLRNRIFSQVFNRAWVRVSMPDAEVRRQTRAYRRGVLRATLASAAIVLVFAALAVANARNARRARDAEAVAKSAAMVAQARTDYANHLVYDFSVSRAFQLFSTDGLAMMERQLDEVRPAGADKDLRGFEWYYLRHVCHSYLREFPRQASEIVALAVSPDGMFLAAACDNGSVFVWTFGDGRQLFTRRYPLPTGGRASLTWSPDGCRLALGTYGGRVHVLDTASWSEIRQFPAGHSPITSLTYTHGGALLITGSNDGTARLWDSRTFREIRHVTAAVARGIWSVAVSPDDKILATGGDDGVARLWDIATGRALKVLRGHSWYIYSLAFSPNGRTLATASGDATAILWNVATGSQVSVLRGHTSYLYALAFSPDGKTLATGAWDHTVRLWDAHTGALLRMIETTFNAWSLAFCMHGSAVAVGCGDGTVQIWSASNSQLYRELVAGTARVSASTYSADGARFITYADDGVIRICDSRSGALLHTLAGRWDNIITVQLLGDVCRILSRSEGVIDVSLGSPAPLNVLRPSPGTMDVAMSGDGQLIVERISAGHAAIRKVGDSSPPVPLADYCPYDDYVFSASGAQVAFQTEAGCMEICDTRTGRVVAQSKGRMPHLTVPLAFSHSGKLLVASDRNRQIYIWDAVTGHLLDTILGVTVDANSAAFTLDDMRLVTGATDGSLTLWDTETWRAALTVATQGAIVCGVIISPDGQQIVTGDSAGKVRIWDAPRDRDRDRETRGRGDHAAAGRQGVSHSVLPVVVPSQQVAFLNERAAM
jgi:WD40 repeat protein